MLGSSSPGLGTGRDVWPRAGKGEGACPILRFSICPALFEAWGVTWVSTL